MAKTKAKHTREPVLKKNWRPMNLGEEQGTLELRSPGPGLRCPRAGGRVESADITHGAIGDLEARSGVDIDSHWAPSLEEAGRLCRALGRTEAWSSSCSVLDGLVRYTGSASL